MIENLDPDSTFAIGSRGQVYVALGRYQEALADFDRALELDPDLVWVVRERAALRISQGDLAGAIADYEDLLETAPDDLQVLNSTCWTGSLSGQAEKYLPTCDRSVTLSNNDPFYRDARGLARALTGDIPGAIEDFQAFVDSLTLENYPSGTEIKLWKPKREAWIRALQSGENPFTPQVLEGLHSE